MKRVGIVLGIGVTAFALLGGCSAAEEEDVSEGGEGALSRSECDAKAAEKKKQVIAACAATLERAKMPYNTCKANAEKAFKDAVAALSGEALTQQLPTK